MAVPAPPVHVAPVPPVAQFPCFEGRFASTIRMPRLLNGPDEVGLSAASGDYDDTSMQLKIVRNANNVVMMEETIARLPAIDAVSDEAQRMYVIATMLIIANGWYLDSDDGKVDANVTFVTLQAAPAIPVGGFVLTQAFVDGITKDDIANAALMTFSTKVNMWAINHHVGQGGLQGFASKVAALVFDNPKAGCVSRVMWVVGHWACTIAAWAKWDVTTLKTDKDSTFERWPVATRDIRMRMEAGPAGAAKITTAKAALKVAVRSVFSMLMPVDDGYCALARVPNKVMSAVYHEGSQKFTGYPKEDLADIQEDTLVAIAAFVHAVMPNSSLAKAKVLPSIDDVRASDTYSRIRNVVTALRDTGGAKKDVAAVRLVLGMGVSSDPMGAAMEALSMNRREVPTAEEVEKAEALLAQEETAAAARAAAKSATK